MADHELDDLERRLMRGVLVRRLVIGIGAIALGVVVTLRVGEIRADLGIHHADPIPWKTIALAASGLSVLLGLVAAWPLGIYRWAGTLASPCRSVLTARDAAALRVAPFEVDHVVDHPSACSLAGLEPRGDRRIVAIEIDGPRSGYRFEDRIRSFRATDTAHVFERSGERLIAIRAPKGALYVHLASNRYDEGAARRIAEHVAAKVDLVDRFPDR